MDPIAEPQQVGENSAMADPATQLQSMSSAAGFMDFEQPLTERMRTFLRLELLHEQTCFHGRNPSEMGARAAVSSLLEILTILNRGDVRTEALKELERQRELLASFARQPGVDPARLKNCVDGLRGLQERLGECGPKFMIPLKECEFLSNIKHRSSIPGGTCTFDLPDYAFWLRLPDEQRSGQFLAWLDIIRPLCDAVSQILWLTREANAPEERTAAAGMYQRNLKRGTEPSLVRVLLPAGSSMYPEISAGKHRFTVRFRKWRGTGDRAVAVERDVRFLLAMC